MSRRSSGPLWLLGTGSVLLILATLAFFLYRYKVCPDCGGAGGVRQPEVRMARGFQPCCAIHCPRCREKGKVSLFQALLGPRFVPEVRELMEGVSDTLGVTLEVRMDDILQREGLKFVDIVGWPQPYPQSYSGWVRFIGDSHVLYMAHGRASADRKITCAVLIDRQGHVADHLSCSVDSFQGYVVPYFATDADGGTLLLSGEDRLTPAEFTLKHRDGVEVFQPDPPYTIKRGVIRFRVVDGKLQITERPSGPGVDGKR